VIPLVQSALNHASLPSLGELASITVFTGLPAEKPLDVIRRKDHKKLIETRKTAEEIRALTASLRDALLELQKKIISTASRLRTQMQTKFEKHQLPNFEIGDFVLLTTAEKSLLQSSVQHGLALQELSKLPETMCLRNSWSQTSYMFGKGNRFGNSSWLRKGLMNGFGKMERDCILMFLMWFKALLFLTQMLAERKLLQSFSIFKNEPHVY
jgi:hypothetical protein